MTNEFKKIKKDNETRYILESASGGGTSSGGIASVSSALGGTRKRGDNLLAQEANKKEAPKPRNFVAKNAKMGGAGKMADKSKTIPRKEKHKKPVAEGFNGEYDDEAGMAHTNLLTSARAVMGLLKTIDDKDNLPEWVQEKIAKAEMMLVGVWDYLQSQKEQGINPQVGVTEGGMGEAYQELQDIVSNEDFDALYQLFTANTPAGKFVQDMYDDVVINTGLHPDDDFERIEQIVFDRLSDEFGDQDVSEERTETKNEKGEVVSWKDEGEWKPSKGKEGRGKVTNLSDKARKETEKLKNNQGVKEDDIEEGWKEKLAGATLAGAMALGAGGAHARVGADYQDNPEINRLTGQPKATQVAPSDDKAKTPAISQYTPGVEHPAAYTIAYQGKEYKFAGRDADAPPDGKVITVGAGAIGIRGLKPVKVVLGDDGKYYVGNNTNEGYYNNYDSNRTGFKKPRPDVSGEGEPPGMFMVVVNGRDWKEFTSNKAFSVAKTIASKNPDKKVQVRWPNGALNSVAEAVAEVSPPGWEKTVKAMKKHKEIDNPWALAWSMKNKGYKSHKKESIDPYFKSLISKLEEKAKK